MHLFKQGVVGLLACCHLTHALEVIILADTNRDGVVDDSDGTADGEALFLANIGDSEARCSKSIDLDTPRPDIDDCHDASDNILRNGDFLAPLRTLPITEDLGGGTYGFINVTGKTAAENVRIFAKLDGGEWDYVYANTSFDAGQLANGLELGIDARDVRRPDGWDGRVTVHFTVQPSDGEASTSSVDLRVAPVLMHHHAQAAEYVFTADDSVGLTLPEFNDALRSAVKAAGINKPVYGFTNIDKWVQDFFEPAYSSIPGPDGPIVSRIMLRSSQNRPSGGQVFTHLRAATVGAAQHIADGDSIDSTGNLETVPPYTHNGKSWPAGRAYMGGRDGRLPFVFDFLRAQEVQDPIELDTEWLMVGHVDEFVQFLPAPQTERGWVMMVDDPMAGLDLLFKASDAGYGDVLGLSRPRMDYDPDVTCLPNITLDEVLSLPNFIEYNEFAADRIDFNVNILKEEVGVTDDEIFRVPALFYDHTGWECGNLKARTSGPFKKDTLLDIVKAAGELSDRDGLQARQSQGTKVIAHYPSVINGVVLSGKDYLAANPWGPVINGKDILADAVKKVYAEAAGFGVTFMDDWFSHHTTGGEIHCGTNVWRNTDDIWW